MNTMDTAPRDGTKFHGQVDEDLIAMFWHEGFGEFVSRFNRMTLAPGMTFDDTGLGYKDHSPVVHKPTGWRPMPEPTPDDPPHVACELGGMMMNGASIEYCDDEEIRVLKDKRPLSITTETASWRALLLLLLGAPLDSHSTAKATALVEAIHYRVRREETEGFLVTSTTGEGDER